MSLIIIIFVLIFVLHADMAWKVSYESLPIISVFRYILVAFLVFQITSDYLIPCFPLSSSGETTVNLEGSTLTRPSTLFYSF